MYKYLLFFLSIAFVGCSDSDDTKQPEIVIQGNVLISYPEELIPSDGIVTLPATVKTIGKNAFRNSQKLKEIQASSVTTVALSAFKGCSHLTTVKLNGAKELADSAFAETPLSVVYVDKAPQLGKGVFYQTPHGKTVYTQAEAEFSSWEAYGFSTVNKTPIGAIYEPYFGYFITLDQGSVPYNGASHAPTGIESNIILTSYDGKVDDKIFKEINPNISLGYESTLKRAGNYYLVYSQFVTPKQKDHFVTVFEAKSLKVVHQAVVRLPEDLDWYGFNGVTVDNKGNVYFAFGPSFFKVDFNKDLKDDERLKNPVPAFDRLKLRRYYYGEGRVWAFIPFRDKLYSYDYDAQKMESLTTSSKIKSAVQSSDNTLITIENTPILRSMKDGSAIAELSVTNFGKSAAYDKKAKMLYFIGDENKKTSIFSYNIETKEQTLLGEVSLKDAGFANSGLVSIAKHAKLDLLLISYTTASKECRLGVLNLQTKKFERWTDVAGYSLIDSRFNQ